MAGEWIEKTISDFVYVSDYVANGSFSSIKQNVQYLDNDGYAILVRFTDFNNSWKGPFRYVNKHAYDFLSKSNLFYGDILISNVGAYAGTVFQVPSLHKPMTLAPNSILVRPNETTCLPNYIFYYFQSAFGKNKLNSIIGGSAVPKFNKTDFRNLKIPLPPLAEQKRIAHLLGSLDDKIELNRKMNETLEEMAQAIFKSWFIDFDGVPTEDLVDSELGLIPKGWEVKPLDKVATFLNGAACQKFRPKDGEDWLPVIKIKQMREGNTDGADKASINIPKKWHIVDGDVLFSWSASLIVDIWTGGSGALNQHLFKVTSELYPRWYYLLWSKYHLAEFQRIAAAKATTMGHIKRSHLAQAKVLIPSDEELLTQTNTFKPILDRLVANRLQTKTLSELRDTLLPKLISGEIRIPEAEEQVEQQMALFSDEPKSRAV